MIPIRVAPEERFVLANGLRHHTLRWHTHPWGEGGPRVVLCHGFLDHAWSFQPLGERLALAGFEVLAFSFRGHGETDRSGAGAYYHFANYILDLHDLWPSLSDAEGKAHLLGHSMGGTVSSVFAASHPGKLRSLILVEGLGPPEYPAEEAPRKLRSWLADVDRVRGKAPYPGSLSTCLKAFRARHPEVEEELARFLVEKATRRAEAEEGEGYLFRYDPMHRSTSPTPFSKEGYLAQLRCIDAPTLIVSGERGFRTADHEERVAAIDDVEQTLLAGVGHMIHWEKAEELAALAIAHFRSSEGGS